MLRSKPQRWIPELRFGYPPLRNVPKSFREKLGIFLESLGGSQRQLCIKTRPLKSVAHLAIKKCSDVPQAGRMAWQPTVGVAFSQENSRRLWLSEIPYWKCFLARNFDATLESSSPIFRQHEMLSLPRFGHSPASKMAAGKSAPPSGTLLDFSSEFFRKILISVKCFALNSGARNGCTSFMGAWKNCVLLQEKTSMPIKFLVLGGVILGLGGGGKCRFYFYGRGYFSEFF